MDKTGLVKILKELARETGDGYEGETIALAAERIAELEALNIQMGDIIAQHGIPLIDALAVYQPSHQRWIPTSEAEVEGWYWVKEFPDSVPEIVHITDTEGHTITQDDGYYIKGNEYSVCCGPLPPPPKDNPGRDKIEAGNGTDTLED